MASRPLVMELVEGRTLADRIAQGPVPVDEALPIAKQIAEPLEVAHEQGIIHCGSRLCESGSKVAEDGEQKQQRGLHTTMATRYWMLALAARSFQETSYVPPNQTGLIQMS